VPHEHGIDLRRVYDPGVGAGDGHLGDDGRDDA
jgi:hypothetical protein